MSYVRKFINNLINVYILSTVFCIEKPINKTTFNKIITVELCFIFGKVKIDSATIVFIISILCIDRNEPSSHKLFIISLSKSIC